MQETPGDEELDENLKELYGEDWQEAKQELEGSLQDKVNEYAHKRATLSPHEYARWHVQRRAELLAGLIDCGAPRTNWEDNLSQLIKAVEELRQFE